uniref:Uncharacterized protein n=1 Tax=uncultured Sphingobacteriia bacterium TaxID=246143 RepID=F4MM13_9BACT|nr:conserved hypothetical protein [uncultured Sphingobacteriia bacterium]
MNFLFTLTTFVRDRKDMQTFYISKYLLDFKNIKI